MTQKQKAGDSKKKIALIAGLVAIVLALLTSMFVQNVKQQLWAQSINTIMESTQQGCNSLKLQMNQTFSSLEAAADNIGRFSIDQRGQLEKIISGHAQETTSTGLYLENGATVPDDLHKDEAVEEILSRTNQEKGIVDPHISSLSGLNVFDLYMRFVMQDGTQGYFVKEYEVSSIVDNFTLSFYNNSGFSYVVNAGGDVLIRSSHPNSNKTVQNIFDMLPESRNDAESLDTFAQALKGAQTGYAVFDYQGASTVFCYVPLKTASDWYLISIIPEDVVNAQTSAILKQALTLIACILLGIALLVFLYVRNTAKANRKLRNQMNYTEHLYNAIPEAVALISVDFPHRILQMNREGYTLLGKSEDEDGALLGKSLRDLVHPDDYGKMAGLFHEIGMGGQKENLQNRVRRGDGSYFWSAGVVEKSLDENGNAVFIAAFHDITAEKLAEEALERAQRQERQTLVGAISNAYPVIINLNLTKDTLNFIYVQPGLMVGLGEQTSYSRLFEEMAMIVHPEFLEEFKRRFSLESLRAVLGREKKEVSLDMQQMLTDGNYHWTATQIIYVDNPYSEDKLAILLSRRVDDQRHEEEERRQVLQTALDNARAANEAKSRFLSNMSHDIRTPMNVIVGMTAIAAAHLDDRERVADYLKKISLSSKHLLSLINDILDMSKIESGKLSLREEPLNFAELAAEVVELMRPQANEKRLLLDVRLGVLKNENVVGDSLHIRQVLFNIVSNAVKYTPQGGSVTIEVKQENSVLRGYQNYVFRCADTGVGMSDAFLQKLFQPFARALDTTSSGIAGTGLGLAITKNLIDLMNGEILVESSPQKGSVFTVTLPLQLQEAQAEEVPQEWVGVRSLVVDDDKQTCENAVELLEGMGLRAYFVMEGAAAVREVVSANGTADPFQLVIIDWKMPDLDGVEVARRIRQQIGPDIPLIILTAYDWSDIENEARDAGVTGFLSKPFYRSKFCYLLSSIHGEQMPLDAGAKPDYTGKRLLLAEDNELNREIARELIGRTGIQIEESWDGEDALKKVTESPEGYYDLILMDIQMPRMDGYEATRAIRALPRQDTKELPIIAMTANAFEEDVRAALRAGMNAHLSKPIDVELLERILAQYLL